MEPSSIRNSWKTATRMSKTAPVNGIPIRCRSRLGEHSHRRGQSRNIGHRERIAGQAQLLGVRELADAVQLVREVEVAVRIDQEVSTTESKCNTAIIATQSAADS